MDTENDQQSPKTHSLEAVEGQSEGSMNTERNDGQVWDTQGDRPSGRHAKRASEAGACFVSMGFRPFLDRLVGRSSRCAVEKKPDE